MLIITLMLNSVDDTRDTVELIYANGVRVLVVPVSLIRPLPKSSNSSMIKLIFKTTFLLYDALNAVISIQSVQGIADVFVYLFFKYS